MHWSLVSICTNIPIIKIPSWSILFPWWKSKFARIISKNWRSSWIQFRKKPTLWILFRHNRILRPEKKWALSIRVTMDINYEQKLLPIFLLKLYHIISNSNNLRKYKLRLISIFPIQILPRKTCPCITYNNSIRIQHWNYFEYDTKLFNNELTFVLKTLIILFVREDFLLIHLQYGFHLSTRGALFRLWQRNSSNFYYRFIYFCIIIFICPL